MAACAQMAQFYEIPCAVSAGMTDAKIPDFQAGYEKGLTTALAGHAGANYIGEAAGMQASLLGFCLESLVLGDDVIGQALRCVRGIEVTEDSVSIETMRQVCLEGPGHYLGSGQTLQLMQTEYVYPRLGDRTSPKEWVEREKPDLLAIAGYVPGHRIRVRHGNISALEGATRV